MQNHKLVALIAIVITFSTFAYVSAAPYYTFQPTLLPQANNSFDLGTSTQVWRNAYITQLCLSSDCKTAWPTGGAGSASAFEIATTSTIGVSQLAYFTRTSGRTTLGGVATSTLTATNGLTGTFTQVGSGGALGLATINAGVLGAITNGVVPTSQATSTLYGTGIGGLILAWNNGVPQWVATSSIQNLTLTTTGSSGAATLTGTVLNIPQYSGGGGGGSGDPFSHPAAGQSATTSLMLLFGQASTSQFTATSSVYLATGAGNVLVGTTTALSGTNSALTVWGGISSPGTVAPTGVGGFSTAGNEIIGRGAFSLATAGGNTIIGTGASVGSCAYCDNNVVIGAFATTSHRSSVVIGALSQSTGGGNVTIGVGLTNNASNAIVIGTGSSASNDASAVIGFGNSATHADAISLGWGGHSTQNAQLSYRVRSLINEYPSIRLAGSIAPFSDYDMFDLATSWADSANQKARVEFSTYDTAIRTFLRADATGSSVNTMFLGGNVGIGTSTPKFLLQLASSTAPQLNLADGSLTSSQWTLRNAGGNLYFATSSPSTFATSSATAVTINNNGFVGIGTTNPRGALDVQTGGTNSSVTWNGNQLDISGGTNPGFRVYQNGTAGWYFYNGAGGNNFGIFDITAGKDRMVIYDTGQIDFGNSFGSPYMRMSSTGSFGVGSTTPWGRLSADSTNLAAGQPSFVVGSSSRTDLIVTQAGNIGIGTTTPSQVLSISGKVYTTSGVQFGDGTLQTTAAAGVAASNPTFQHLTNTATSTYTTPAGVTALFIRMCGAGGGGDQNGVGNATAGAATYFGSGAATTTALGAAGGTNSGSNDGGAGGTGGATSLGTEIQRINGAQGNTTGNTAAFPGGSGGSSPFGGAAPGVDANSTASNAATNSCSGGGGLSGDTLKHGGGGAGEYVEFTISSPAATYRYAVGVPGQASASRGIGGAGNIIVQEFYH